MCIYAQGGVGKSSLLESLAQHLHRTEGLRTIVFSADGGGVGPMEPAIESGALTFYQMDAFPNPFNWMNQIVSGNIPLDPNDPKTKWRPINFAEEKVGAICNEGLTSWGQILLDWARDEHAEGRQIGQMEGNKLFFKDGEMKLGANTPAHYGIGQSYLGTFVAKARRLWSRGLQNIVWTAIESKVELKKDQAASVEGKATAYGPKLPGTAATAQCIPWFTHVLHLDVVNPKKDPKTGAVEGERRLFLNQHYAEGDPTPYLAKVAVNPRGKLPLSIPADMSVFFKELAEANKRAMLG